MKNNWHAIWNNRNSNIANIDKNDETQILFELKKIAGWDFFGTASKITFDDLYKEYEYFKANLMLPVIGGGTSSVFEVGCGGGANLYLFKKDGFKIGGLDYSENMVEIMREVIGKENLIESICAGADELPVEIKYDAVLAAGVFNYFNTLENAEKTLDLMLAKSKKSIGATRILAEETKEEYMAFRRKNDPNYDERYKDLPRLFISKDFFAKYAEKNNLDVKFDRYKIKNYWNEPFIFDCFLYKK